MPGPATRERIVSAADQLFYAQGFDHTSFADIAGAVNISRGNVTYHFETKDEILDAVIQARLVNTAAMLARWENDGETPAQRIRSFIDILIVNGDKIKNHGCPVGTLRSELAKLNHAAQDEANKLFTLFRVWLRRLFEDLGRAADADALALHLLAMSQGVATLYNAFQDKAFVQGEVERMYTWLDAVALGKD